MHKTFLKNKNQKGYAILFTIIIVSAISVITAGLSNTAYKQLILSSLAKDSQTAFYQSDTATDCALYADRVEALNPTIPESVITMGGGWICGNANLTVTPGVGGSYTILPNDEDSPDPCFRINVIKEVIGQDGEGIDIIKTTIQARGYNICNVTNLRTVEREIEISYQE